LPARTPWFACCLLLCCLTGTSPVAAAEVGSPQRPAVAARLVRIPLPIAGEVDSRIKAMVDQLLGEWREAPGRPVLILEFRGREGATGRGSQFERALALARYLAGEPLGRVRTVAYVSGKVEGHAVLPILACEELIAHPDGELGPAGIDETFIDDTIRRGYTEVTERRRTVPVSIVMAMLQAQEAVHKVQTQDGVRYVRAGELEALQKDASVRSIDQVVAPGQLASFTGSELRLKLGFASHLARDRLELGAALHLSSGAIEEDPALGAGRRGLLVDVSGPIHRQRVAWVEKSVREKIEQDKVNYVCLTIDSPGGAAPDSIRLAAYLAQLDPSEVRTVAFVATEARADAALVALACDQIYLSESAVLGGPGARRVHPKQLADARVPLAEIAKAKQRDWSLLLAMLDPQLGVRRYTDRTTGAVRYFCGDELTEQKEAPNWQAGDAIEFQHGLQGPAALELGLAKALLRNFAELKLAQQLDEHLETARPNWAFAFLEFLSSPEIAGALLFIAWFALMIEFMQPGLSGAGFVSGLCFLLFFWAKFLHGTAGWLEVLLFVAGVTCVAIELFILPGFGIFGIGGGLLVVASIVLASQTFVLPGNEYQWRQLPSSLFMVAAAGFGALASMVVMRRALSRAPVFQRVGLDTPDEARREQIAYQEALAHREHLLHRRGVTLTQLTPCGKARFEDDLVDVLTDGDVLPAGCEVVVVEVRGNEVVVRPAP
jgi:membrane-bound ClpP family serine protease